MSTNIKSVYRSLYAGDVLKNECAIFSDLSQPVIYGVTGHSLCLFAAARLSVKSQVLMILPGKKETDELFVELSSFLTDKSVFLFPEFNVMPYENVNINEKISFRRLEAIYHLLAGTPAVFLTSAAAMTRVMMPRAVFEEKMVRLKKGDIYDKELLLEKLISNGYFRVSLCREPGEIAVRGSIIDIFSPAMKNPVRLDFFDNELEDIRVFDSLSQTSITSISSTSIVPRSEMWLPSDAEKKFKTAAVKFHLNSGEKNQNVFLNKDLSRSNPPGLYNLLPFFYPKATLEDYLNDDVEIAGFNPEHLISRVDFLKAEYEAEYKRQKSGQTAVPPPDALFARHDFFKKKLTVRLKTVKDKNAAATIGVGTHEISANGIKNTQDQIKHYIRRGYNVIVTAEHPSQVKKIAELFRSLNPQVFHHLLSDDEKSSMIDHVSRDGQFFIVEGIVGAGALFPESKVVIVADYEIFNRKRKYHKQFDQNDPARVIEHFIDIQVGDLVVHINEGIGRYKGLEKIKRGREEKDYLKIEYAQNSSLLIPVEQINLIQKYIGGRSGRTALDHLGGSAWQKLKRHVKKSVEVVAKDLVELYAKRQAGKKCPFAEDTYWQAAFEAEFPYTETPDQLKVVEDIKKDMMSDKPMDRLVCGDVGFGKTEVAMRAVFKAVMENRQAIVLVPTTILSEQHYRNFLKRFENYPVTIKLLNRFQKKNEIQNIYNGLKNNQIDILIGTHRLFSKSVPLKNIGLLVIDEEQKFGVKQKEKIRTISADVDTLALSATPIPRTLHMSLVKIRDISVINTPPDDRLPVQSFLCEFDEDVIVKAVNREISRNGQIFFLHNSVETIYQAAAYIQKLMPDLKIGVGHGKMPEHEIENVMEDFLENKIQMLVCTTIIDSGLDIANANTIFINNAENLGLSQLYQLKGRVGRSNRQSYAYFFYRKNKALSEDAMKRLNSIVEHTDLGAGFKIAMRDLEIRGAGTLLGEAQSGDIMAVGFELYCNLLNEAVAKLTAEEKTISSFIQTALDIKYSGYIPDIYIPSQKQKIEVYKKLAGIRTGGQKEQIQKELLDRYGSPPEIINKLFYLSGLRIKAQEMKIDAVSEKVHEIAVKLSKESLFDRDKMFKLVQSDENIYLKPAFADMVFLNISDIDQKRYEHRAFYEKIDRISEFLDMIKAG